MRGARRRINLDRTENSTALACFPPERPAGTGRPGVAMTGLAVLVIAVAAHGPALAQKQGGILHSGHFDSPASMSLLEESTLAVNRPIMGVFNNLVMFDQQVAQNSPQSIIPDLATGWSWNCLSGSLTTGTGNGSFYSATANCANVGNTWCAAVQYWADGNANNVIDTADYTYWRNRFGTTSGSGAGFGSESLAGVPEPSAFLLLLMGGCAPALSRKWR